MYSITTLSQHQFHYPERLKEIADPPDTLYVAGDVSVFTQPAIAVVGSRAMTRYGEQVCRSLVNDLVSCGFVIVSGLATGIDAMAHRTAIAAGGKTIAVLGSGMAQSAIYPVEHVPLASKIANGYGIVVSEYEPTAVSQRYFFPQRNRIIAGLTLGTLVIEARLQSGALITAKYALEYNREVFAVPGSIVSSRSAGTHALLRQGAVLVESAQDIVRELDQANVLSFQQSTSPQLTRSQLSIVQALEQGYARPEELQLEAGISPQELSSSLTELEIRGIVRKNTDYSYTVL